MDRHSVEDYLELVRRKRLERARRQHDAEWKRQRDERLKAREEADEALHDDVVVAAVAVVSQIEAQRERIDAYDAATVAALMKNEEELAAAEASLAEMLESAFILPDGRRVFRTEDGLRVFDEHGTEVAGEVVDPSAIPDGRPKWEAFSQRVVHVDGLLEERQELLDYQERLDEARDRLDDGDLTQDELDDLAADMESDMPAAVRRELDEMAPGAEARSDRRAPRSPGEDVVTRDRPATAEPFSPLRGPGGGP